MLKSKECSDVSNQEHYTQFNIQPIEFCHVNGLGWCEANVVKYVCRYKKKNGAEDLKKARAYLDCLINYELTGKFTTPDKMPEVKE